MFYCIPTGTLQPARDASIYFFYIFPKFPEGIYGEAVGKDEWNSPAKLNRWILG